MGASLGALAMLHAHRVDVELSELAKPPALLVRIVAPPHRRHLQEQEARVAASDEMRKTSVDQQFEQLGASDEIEKKLAALKQKMGK